MGGTQESIFRAMHSKIKLRRRASRRWPSELVTRCLDCQTTLFGYVLSSLVPFCRHSLEQRLTRGGTQHIDTDEKPGNAA